MTLLALQTVEHYNQALRQPGICALWCQEGDSKRLLSVHPSEDVHSSVRAFQELQQLRVYSGNKITFSVGYMPNSSPEDRASVARQLIRQHV